MPEISDITPSAQQANDVVLVRRGAAAPFTLALLDRDELGATLPTFTDTLQGVVPASGGDPEDFLSADGTWARPVRPTVQDEGSPVTTALEVLNVVGRGARATGSPTVVLTVDGVIAAAPSSDQHNWAPAGLDAGTGLIKLQPTTNSFITGIAAGAADQRLELTNDSTFVVCIERESAASTAANRISYNGLTAIWLLPGETVSLRYSATLQRWVVTAMSKDVYALRAATLIVQPNNTTSVSADGMGSASVAVTATLSTTHPTGAGDEFTEFAFFQGTNSTAAGTTGVRGSVLSFLRGSTAAVRGFFHTGMVRFTALGATGAVRAGMTSSSAVSTTLNAALTNCLLLGADAGQTTLRIFHNDAAGAAVQIDLGANFPVPNATAAYEYCFYAPPGSSFVRYMVRRLDTRFVAEGSLLADLPSQTQGLNMRVEAMVGATAAANTVQCARLLTMGL